MSEDAPQTKRLVFELQVPHDFPDPKAALHILLMPNGQDVLCVGPVRDKALAYAMLELARDAIDQLHDRLSKEAENRIVKPSVQDVSRITH